MITKVNKINSKFALIEQKILSSLLIFGSYHNIILKFKEVFKEYKRHRFAIIIITSFFSYFWILYSDYWDFLDNQYGLFLLEIYLKFNNSSLIVHFSVVILLSGLLYRLVFSIYEFFKYDIVSMKNKAKSMVDTIIFYIFANMWRMCFSDYTTYYEYNYLDLFSEIVLLFIFLLFSEPIKPVLQYWEKVH